MVSSNTNNALLGGPAGHGRRAAPAPGAGGINDYYHY